MGEWTSAGRRVMSSQLVLHMFHALPYLPERMFQKGYLRGRSEFGEQ
jgi:hypothetical protein